MCNVWNTGVYTRNGCRCGGYTTVNTINTTNTTNGTGDVNGFCGYWNGTWQRMCRDACGNILTRNGGGGCGCQQCCHHCCQRPCCCGCNVGNGTTGNNGVTGNNGGTVGIGNGNGVFRCVTFCGFGNGVTQTTGTARTNDCDTYYARQYGLTCDDNAECVYNF